MLPKLILLLVMVCLLLAHRRKPKPKKTIKEVWKTQIDFKSCFIKCHQDIICASFKFKQKTLQCAGYPGSSLTSGAGRHGTLFNFCQRTVCAKQNGYTWLPRSKMCINIVFDPKPWQESESTCESEHAHLAVLNSKIKMRSVLHHIRGQDTTLWQKMNIGRRVWVGMRRHAPSRTYKWIRGTSTYAWKWSKADPSYNDEECVMIGQLLSDTKCWFPRFPVCQMF